MCRLKQIAFIIICLSTLSSIECSIAEESILSNQAGDLQRCDALLQGCIDICQIIDPKNQSPYCLLICEAAYNACLNPTPQPPVTKPLPRVTPIQKRNIS